MEFYLYKKTEITFMYGKDNINIKVPEKSIIAIPHINYLNKLKNELTSLTKSLRSPIGCPPLFEIAQREKCCCNYFRPY